MDEKSILLYVAILIGYLLSFFCGYLVCKSRGKRLAGYNQLCETDGGSVARATESVTRVEDGINNAERTATDLGSGIESIADIIRKYENTATEKQELESSSDRSVYGDIDD